MTRSTPQVLVFVAGGAMAGVREGAEGRRRHGAHAAARSDQGQLLLDAAHDAGVLLTKDAATRIEQHLAEDAGRAVALVDILANARDTGTRLDVGDVEPYLGAEGGVPIYTLTNVIEEGDSGAPARSAPRLLTVTSAAQQPKPMHPSPSFSTLLGYYRRLMRLDDPDIRNSADAVVALGRKGGKSSREGEGPRCVTGSTRDPADPHRVRCARPGRPRPEERAPRDPAGRTVIEVLVVRLTELNASAKVWPGAGGAGGRGGGRRRG